MSHRFTGRLAAVATSVTASLAVVAGGAAIPASADGAPLHVTSVQEVNNGGGLSGYLQLHCAVEVEFTDGSPSTPEAYEVTVLDAHGESLGTYDGAYSPLDIDTDLTVQLGCGTFPEGDPVTLRVDELDEGGSVLETDTSEPYTFGFTGHPGEISNTSVKRDGVWTNFVGRKVTVTFTDGEWEPGTEFQTQVWTSRTRTFTAQDWEDNVSNGAAIVQPNELDTPVLTWTPRKRDAGRWVWYSVMGRAPGKAAWMFWFAPEYVSNGAQPRAAWYVGYGKKAGVAKVGRTIRVTPPSLTRAGSKAGISTTHQWYVKRSTGWQVLTGKKRSSLALTRSLRGKPVKVVVTYRARTYLSFTRGYAWDRVRG